MLNLRQFAFDLKLQQAELVEVLGIAQSQVSNMMNGIRKVRLEHIEKLRAKYGDIVDNYRTEGAIHVRPAVMTSHPVAQSTVTGNGNAIVNGNGNTVNAMADVVVAEVKPSGEVVPIVQPPVVPDKIVRDPNVTVLDWVNDPDNDHSQNAFNIASILRRTKCIIRMDNSAMAPALYQNEFAFLKPFAKDSEIIDGEIYGIETKERGILIRFLYDDGDCYLTRPKNTREFGDIRIPKDKVVNKYHIVFHGSTHLSSFPDNEGEMARQLEQQSKYISTLINQNGEAMTEISKGGQRIDRLIDMIDKGRS